MALTGRSSDTAGHIGNIVADLEVGDEVVVNVNRPPNGVKDAVVGDRARQKKAEVIGVENSSFTIFNHWRVYAVYLEMDDGHGFKIASFVRQRKTFNVKFGNENLYTVQKIEVTG